LYLFTNCFYGSDTIVIWFHTRANLINYLSKSGLFEQEAVNNLVLNKGFNYDRFSFKIRKINLL